MSEQEFQDKTEKATPKRRQESREEGRVALSKEISSVFVLLSGVGIFSLFGTWIFFRLKEMMFGFFEKMGTFRIDDLETGQRLLTDVSIKCFVILCPLFIALLISGFASNIFQVGVMFSTKRLSPDFSKLNPIKGLKKLLSIQSIVEVIKSIAKIMIVGGVVYTCIHSQMSQIPHLMKMDVYDIVSFSGNQILKICFYTSLALIVLAIVDYGFQRYQYEKSLMMTKQELKEEIKQTEGDPKVKQRIKSAQLEMLRLRMYNTVPESSVIITNPTHIAVAVKFDFGKMHAPMVIAKGAGFMAVQIKKIATSHNVPIIENKPLARVLFKTLKIGEYIPPELYQSLAEILAYIYRLQGKL